MGDHLLFLGPIFAKYLTPMKSFLYFLCFGFTSTLWAQKSPYDVSSNTNQPKDSTPQSEFAKKFPRIIMADWKTGMKFMTEPLKIKALGSASRIELAPYKSLNFVNDQVRQGDFEWKTFTYQSKEMRTVKCATGTCKNTYLIFECEGKKYEYEFIGDTAALRKAPNTYIKKIVYLDEVDKIKAELNGKTLYVLCSQWMKEDEKGKIVNSDGYQKFVAVTVTSVGLGTQDGPSKIVFKQDGTTKEAFINLRLSGINKSSGLFGVDFDKAFSFKDPKKKYPKIKSEIWTVIQNESMRLGMTKEEAELSWGKPKEIIMSGSTEQWVYETSGTLTFKNGIIIKIDE